jgi:hypothetical protein
MQVCITWHADLFLEAISIAFIGFSAACCFSGRVTQMTAFFTGWKRAILLHRPHEGDKSKNQNSRFYIAKKTESAVLMFVFSSNVKLLSDGNTSPYLKNCIAPSPIRTPGSDKAILVCHTKSVISGCYRFGTSDALDCSSKHTDRLSNAHDSDHIKRLRQRFVEIRMEEQHETFR